MTEETYTKVREGILDAVFAQLKEAHLGPEEGVSVLMSACVTFLASTAQFMGVDKLEFVADVFAQALEQFKDIVSSKQ